MIKGLLDALGELEAPPTAQEIAEALWLAEALPPGRTAPLSSPFGPAALLPAGGTVAGTTRLDGAPEAGEQPGAWEPGETSVHLRTPDTRPGARRAGIPVHVPAVSALKGTKMIARALRPLCRRFPSMTRSVLDEAATAASIADDGLWSPRYRPVMDRWLDLTLVVDESTSMAIWRQTITEFRRLLDRLGAFRDLRTWRFDGDQSAQEMRLTGESDVSAHRPRELLDPTGRRVILVVSDCIGAAWSSGAVARALEDWTWTSPVAVLQPLPERMWALCGQLFTPVRFHASRPGLPTRKVTIQIRGGAESQGQAGSAIPVLEMDADARWLACWASLVAGSGWIPGVAMQTGLMTCTDRSARTEDPVPALDRVLRFRDEVSPTAYLLAGYLAAAPLSLPVMRIVQSVMLPQSRPAHLAEILLSDLLLPTDGDGSESEKVYEFRDDVRSLLLAGLPRGDTLRVLDEVSRFLSPRLGSPSDFRAVLDGGAEGIMAVGLPFAKVAYIALQALGGYYAEIAAKLEPHLGSGDMPSLHSAAETSLTRPTERPPSLYPSEGAAGRGQHKHPGPIGGPSHTPGENVTEPISGRRKARERHSAIPAGWETVPRRNPHFTGREKLLLDLHSQLSSAITALVPHALHGLGGVGKTQLAVEYAYRFATEYDLVWWIPAEEHEQIISSLVELARLMELPISEDASQTVRSVLEELLRGTTYQRWLLVYDNAGAPETVLPYVPSAVGDILITSLDQEWLEAAYTIRVDVFTRRESIDLIMRRGQGITEEDADRLAERLGDLPLAIEQAATWQRQTGMAVDDYLDLLDEQHHKLLSVVRSLGHPQPVAEAWGVAFDRLFEEDRAAAELLQLCAFFGPEPISIQILHFCRNVLGVSDELRAAAHDSIMLHSAIRKIGRYGLAQVEAGESLRVHRLVQAVLRDRIPEDRQNHYRRLVHLVLAEANPGDPDNRAGWFMLDQISRHIVRSTGLIEGGDESDAVRQVIIDQIRYRYVKGDNETSRELADTALRIWREKYGDSDKLVLISSRHLGNALRALGRYAEALTVDSDTLERMREVLGEDDEHTLMAASSYGADLRIQGRYEEALQLDKQNLARHVANFGADERNTLRNENNLAVDLRLKGEFKEALICDEKILRARELKFGPNDQDTLFAQCMVARDLRGNGDYKGAMTLYQEVLPDFQRALGEFHQDVLSTRLSYGLTMMRAGRYEQARNEVEEVFQIFQRRFGPEHPGSMRAMTILASPLRLLGNKGRAHDLAEQALRLATRVYGDDHVFTWLYASNHAITLRGLGLFDLALEADERILPKIRDTLGEGHVFSVSSVANLASSLYHIGNHARAREVSQSAFAKSATVRGADKPLTLACACNLALDLKATGEEDASRQLAAQAVEALTSILGVDSQVVEDLAAGVRYEFDIEPPRL